MQGQDFTKLLELSKHVAKELKNYHPHMTVVITADYVRVDESVIGLPISARMDKPKLNHREWKEKESAELANVITNHMMSSSLTLEVLDEAKRQVEDFYRFSATIRR